MTLSRSLFLLIALILPLNISFSQYEKARELMVKTQIEARGIKDRKVLAAFSKVERHKFVSERYIDRAYDDNALPIDEEQTISSPYIVALMTEALNLKKNDRVLEIGTGSGYQAAILSELCSFVYSIEIFSELGKKARSVLKELGYDNIKIKIDDGYKGWRQYAPYDAIIVTCAPTHIPEPLKDQLAEGGRMIIPVGTPSNQKLVLLKKKRGKIIEERTVPVVFTPMIHKRKNRYIKY